MNDDAKKRIDEDWKNQVSKEKDEVEEKSETYHQPTFSIFLSSLSMQAMIAMGKIKNPINDKVEANYDQARFLIDTLDIIKKKTENNLTLEEETSLNDYLFNLRMMYVEGKKTA